MGTASIVIGFIGFLISWIPTIGWAGLLLGLLGIAFGIPSVTHWYHKPGYAPWGISGLINGMAAMSVSLAYQLKYLHESLPIEVPDLELYQTAILLLVCGAATALGLYIARTKNRPAGIVTASIALASLVIIGTSALVTADRQYQARVETSSLSR